MKGIPILKLEWTKWKYSSNTEPMSLGEECETGWISFVYASTIYKHINTILCLFTIKCMVSTYKQEMITPNNELRRKIMPMYRSCQQNMCCQVGLFWNADADDV